MKKIASSLVFLIFLAVGYATTNDSIAGGKGSPPEIVNVYFEPREPTLTDSVYLVIEYTDPDGDVVNANLYYAITGTGGYKRVVHDGLLAKPEAAFIMGQREGQAKILLGSKWHGKPLLVIRLYLIDAEGNKSETVGREVNILSR
jgi:hypothetical protein